MRTIIHEITSRARNVLEFHCSINLFCQEPDFQENEYMYDDFDLEADIASCKLFLKIIHNWSSTSVLMG